MKEQKQPIEDPAELMSAIEQTLRKNIQSVITLYEYGKIDESVSNKLVKTDKFLLALIMKLQEEYNK